MIERARISQRCGTEWPDDAVSSGACGADPAASKGPPAATDADFDQEAGRHRFQAACAPDVGDRTVRAYMGKGVPDTESSHSPFRGVSEREHGGFETLYRPNAQFGDNSSVGGLRRAPVCNGTGCGPGRLDHRVDDPDGLNHQRPR